MKKILFGITSLTLGGAERVLVDIANEIKDEYQVEIFTIYSDGVLEKQIDPKIKIKSLYNFSYNSMSKIQKILVPIRILMFKKKIYNKYVFDNYDTEVAFLEGAISRIFSIRNKRKERRSGKVTRKIVWIHNDIAKVFGENLKAKLKMYVDKKTYSKYDRLIFVSNDNLNSFNKIYKDIRNDLLEPIKKEVVYNYIDRNKIIEKSKENIDMEFSENQINFLTVARLVKQKGIDRIIKVSSKLKKNGLTHKFYVIGEGPERKELEKLIKENGLEETFILLGAKTNPYPYVKKADYFCLLSHFEGYPIVLEEAKILNINILITNTAARESLQKYDKGQIIENNEDDIYEKMKDILENKITTKKELNDTEYNNKYMIEKIKEILEG